MEHASYDRHGKLIEDALGNKLKRAFTSSLILVPAFIISNVIFQLITWLAAKLIGYRVGISFNEINISHDYRDWNLQRVLAVDLPAPVICLVISIILYRSLSKNPQWINTLRLFIFWLMVCFANLFFSQLSAAPVELAQNTVFYYNHFSCIGSWLGFNAGLMLFFTIVSVLCTILFGAVIGREILRFSFSKGLITTQWGKSAVVFQFFVFPVAISFVPLALLGTGISISRICLTLVSLFIIALGILFRGAIDTNIVRCNKKDVLNHVPIIELAIAGIAWVAIYFFFRT